MNSKNKKELLYWVSGIALAIALFIYTFMTLQFMIGALSAALNRGLIKPVETVRFNLDKIKDLQIPGIQ